MIEEQNPLEQLFSQARHEVPKTTYQDTEKMFLKALTLGGIGLLTTKGIAYLLKLKFSVIMLSTAGIVATSIVVIQAVNPEPPSPNTNAIITAATPRTEQVVEPEVTIEPAEDTFKFTVETPEPETIAPLQAHIGSLITTPDFPEPPNPIAAMPAPKPNTQNCENTCKSHRYVITERSTEADIAKIQDKAAAAGINVEVTIKTKRDRIKYLNFSMELVTPDQEKKTSTISISGADDFTVQIGWVTNADGKAIKFTDHDSELGRYPSSFDLEKFELAIEKTELAIERLAEELEAELSEDSLEVLEDKLELLEEKLALKIEDLEVFLSETNWEAECDQSIENLEEHINNVTIHINHIINNTISDIQNNEALQENLIQLEQELIQMEEQIIESVEEGIEKIEAEIEAEEAEEEEANEEEGQEEIND